LQEAIPPGVVLVVIGSLYTLQQGWQMNEYLATSADEKWFKVELESLIAKAALVRHHLPKLVSSRFSSRPGKYARDRSAAFNSFSRFQRRQLKASWELWGQIEAEIKRSLMDAAIGVLDSLLDNFKEVSKSNNPLTFEPA
jgi:hypothetical protein